MQLLASGRSALVYAIDDHRVLQRDLRGRNMTNFARLLRFLAEQGVPVPAVLDVNGSEVVMERVYGGALLSEVHDVSSLGGAAIIIGGLHRTLDRLTAPPELPAMAGVDPASSNLVHLDLHPGNVLRGPDGLRLIDWENAARAPRAVDVAMSAIILGQAPELDAIALPAQRQRAVVALLDAAGNRPSSDEMAVAARRRLRDGHLTALERQRVAHLPNGSS